MNPFTEKVRTNKLVNVITRKFEFAKVWSTRISRKIVEEYSPRCPWTVRASQRLVCDTILNLNLVKKKEEIRSASENATSVQIARPNSRII